MFHQVYKYLVMTKNLNEMNCEILPTQILPIHQSGKSGMKQRMQ
jgi:hypothetical protein